MKKELLAQFALVRDESGAVHFEAENHEKDSLAVVHLLMHGIHYTMNQVDFSEMMKKGVKEFIDMGKSNQQGWLDTADEGFDEYNKDPYIDSVKEDVDDTGEVNIGEILTSQILDAQKFKPQIYSVLAITILKNAIDYIGDDMILITRQFLDDVESGQFDKILEQKQGRIQ